MNEKPNTGLKWEKENKMTDSVALDATEMPCLRGEWS